MGIQSWPKKIKLNYVCIYNRTSNSSHFSFFFWYLSADFILQKANLGVFMRACGVYSVVVEEGG